MLNRKLWRDLVLYRIQFLSVFIMALLGIMVFVGLDTESSGLEISSGKYYNDTNLADFWLAGKAFTNEDERAVERIKGVLGAERKLTVEGNAVLFGDPYLSINFLEGNQEISRLRVIQGEGYYAGAGGVWIDYSFAKARALEVGDALTLRFQGKEITEIIKGTVLAPEYVFYLSDEGAMMPVYGEYGFAYLSECEYPEEEGRAFTQMLVDIDQSSRCEYLRNSLEAVLDDSHVVITDRKGNSSYGTLDAEIRQHKMLGFMFPTVFLMIAVLGIITTMTRLTAGQRVQIGTMKALGLSKGRIIRHYCSFGFWISLAGSLFGAAAGYLWLPLWIFDAMKGAYCLPSMDKVLSVRSVIAIAAQVTVSTLAAYFACRKELSEPPALTLKPKPPGRIKKTVLEKSRFWNRLDFAAQWNYRDICRNKVRSFMGIAGVAGCMMLLITAYGCRDSMGAIPEWMYGKLMTCKSRILLEAKINQADAQEYSRQYAGQMAMETAVELKSKEITKTGSLTVVDMGGFLHFQNESLKEEALPQEGISMSCKMADNLGVQNGDFIKWRLLGEDTWQISRIMFLYKSPAGQGITLSRKAFEKMEYSFKASVIMTNMPVEEDITEQPGIQAVQNTMNMKQDMLKSMAMMDTMVGLLAAAAVILGIVVLYNLGVLSYTEKIRESATLKVLGFSGSKIKKILQVQNIWITAAGIAAGFPLGYGFLNIIMNSLSENQDMPPVLTVISASLSVCSTLAVSLLVSFMLSGKVEEIDMVESLKGTE